MDFNNDVFLKLHRKHDLTPLYQAIRENRVLNPRGTEPINVKSMFEVSPGPMSGRFDPETVRRTPWTRRFFGPGGPPAPGERPSGPGRMDPAELAGSGAQTGARLLRHRRQDQEADHDADARHRRQPWPKGDISFRKKSAWNCGPRHARNRPGTGAGWLWLTAADRFPLPHRSRPGLRLPVPLWDVPTNVGSGGGVQPLADPEITDVRG
jgi:hypothetical protein